MMIPATAPPDIPADDVHHKKSVYHGTCIRPMTATTWLIMKANAHVQNDKGTVTSLLCYSVYSHTNLLASSPGPSCREGPGDEAN